MSCSLSTVIHPELLNGDDEDLQFEEEDRKILVNHQVMVELVQIQPVNLHLIALVAPVSYTSAEGASDICVVFIQP